MLNMEEAKELQTEISQALKQLIDEQVIRTVITQCVGTGVLNHAIDLVGRCIVRKVETAKKENLTDDPGIESIIEKQPEIEKTQEDLTNDQRIESIINQ